MKSINHILDTALKISDQAAELIRMSSQRIKSFKSKGEISNLVTQTDIETDKLISGTIKEIFPDHNIISEELGGNNNNSDSENCYFSSDVRVRFDKMPISCSLASHLKL